MRLNTCPNHPGRVIESHECPICHHPPIPPKDRPPYMARPLVETERERGEDVTPKTTEQTSTEASEFRETWNGETIESGFLDEQPKPAPYESVCPGYGHRDSYNSCQADCPNEEQCQAITNTMDEDDAVLADTHVTLTIGDGTVVFEGTGDEFEDFADSVGQEPDGKPHKPAYAVIDRFTGELSQLSLEGAVWTQYDVEEQQVSGSYSGKMLKSLFDQLVSEGELRHGAIVEVVHRGIVKEHAPIFSKGESQGKTVIVYETIQSVRVLGYMNGTTVAAQNVDGEPKVLEAGTEPAPDETEPAPTDTESPEGETFHDCTTCRHQNVPEGGDPCAKCSTINDLWEEAEESEATDAD